MSSRIAVVARVSGRRAWTVEQKLAMLRDAFGPRGSVRASVDRHANSARSIAIMGRRSGGEVRYGSPHQLHSFAGLGPSLSSSPSSVGKPGRV